MRRPWTLLWLGTALLGTAFLGTLQLWGDGPAPEGKAPAPAADAPSPTASTGLKPDPGFIVHEWGTFTNFSGSDGVHLEFRPLDAAHNDLPNFVYDRSMLSGTLLFLKKRLRARVRMETPVTYFYTDRPRTVRVRVDFPQGLLTEFYPPARAMSPPFDYKAATTVGEPIGNSQLDWGEVDLIPTRMLRPQLENASLARWLEEPLARAAVPNSDGSPHYRHARNTDSALVHMHFPGPPTPGRPNGHFLEKFLFYRGVGKFHTPVAVEYDEQQRPSVVNSGNELLSSIVLLENRNGETRMSVLDAVAPHSRTPLPATNTVDPSQIAGRLQKSLVAAGLYEKEARAMVATWQDSWIAEEGTRLLYLLPTTVTDELLPLQVQPAPKSTVRVMVGRIEMMPPQQERELLAAVSDHAVARSRHLEAVSRLKKESPDATLPKLAIPAAISRLSRFAEPAVARILTIAEEPAVQMEAFRLLQELRQD